METRTIEERKQPLQSLIPPRAQAPVNKNFYEELLKATLQLGGEHKALLDAQQASLNDKAYQGLLKELQAKAGSYGFACHDIDHDGNCFFRAVAHQLDIQHLSIPCLKEVSKDQWHQTLREKAVHHIITYFGFYRRFAEASSEDEFILKISTSGEWADHVLCCALARELKLTLVIIRHEEGKTHIIKQQNPVGIIYLGYIVGKHYQSLKKINYPEAKATRDIKQEIEDAQFDNGWEAQVKAIQEPEEVKKIKEMKNDDSKKFPPRLNQTLFSRLPYRFSKLLRDLDDSSDEDEIEEKNQERIDYDKEYQNGKYDKNVPPLVYLIHVMANRLQYSRAVNKIYYQHKSVLKKSPNESELQIVRNIFKEILTKFSIHLFNFYCTQQNSLIPLENIEKWVIQIFDTQQEKMNTVFTAFVSQDFASRYQIRQKLIEKIYELFVVDVFPIMVQKIRNHSLKFKKAEGFELKDEDQKWVVLFNQLDKKNVQDVAIGTIEDRLTPDGKILNSKERSKFKNKSPESPFARLASYTWRQIEAKRGNTNPRTQLEDTNALMKTYFADLVDDNNISRFWRQIEKYPWLTRYLPVLLKSINVGSLKDVDLFINQMALVFIKESLEDFFETRRPTLGNHYLFKSTNTVELLAQLRLAHRSMQREAKNIQKNGLGLQMYGGKQPKLFFYQWQFFSTPHFSALEKQSVNAGTLSRGAKVDNAGTYKNVFNYLKILKKNLKKFNVDYATLAIWIRKTQQGVLEIDDIFKQLPKEHQEVVLERLGAISYMLFGCEVARNPSSIIIHQMMLDIVIAKTKGWGWKFLLTAQPKEAKESKKQKKQQKEIIVQQPKMPMAVKGIVKYSRMANLCFSKVNGVVFPYLYDAEQDAEQTNQWEEIAELLTAEENIIEQWLISHKITRPIKLNELAEIITDQFDRWFGAGCFNKQEFIYGSRGACK